MKDPNERCQIHIMTTKEAKKKIEDRARSFGCTVSSYIQGLIANDLKNAWREKRA